MGRSWTDEQLRLLAEKYPVMSSEELTALFPDRTFTAIKQRANSLGLRRAKPRFHFTEAQLEELKAIYSNMASADIATKFGCSIYAVHNAAFRLGLKKDIEFIRRTSAERMADPNHPGRACQFKKGSTPSNKGKKWADYMSPEGQVNSSKTQFKKGDRIWNHRPVGWERVNVYGYVEVKVAEPRTFKLKHRIVWEQHHGEIPKGYNVQFKDGHPLNCDIDNLYLISKQEQMLQNSGTLNLPDGIVATYMATTHRKLNPELRDELKNRPELLEVKRQQIILNRELKNQKNGKGNAHPRKNDR